MIDRALQHAIHREAGDVVEQGVERVGIGIYLAGLVRRFAEKAHAGQPVHHIIFARQLELLFPGGVAFLVFGVEIGGDAVGTVIALQIERGEVTISGGRIEGAERQRMFDAQRHAIEIA